MRNCPACGTPNLDSDFYCQHCGASLFASMQSAANGQRADWKQTFRRYVGSPLLLAAILVYALSVLISVGIQMYNWVLMPDAMAQTVYQISRSLGMTDLSSWIVSNMEMANAIALVINLATMLPQFLIVSGLLAFYISCKRKGEQIKTGGLSILNVIIIVLMSFTILALALLLFVFLLMLIVIAVEEDVWPFMIAIVAVLIGLSATLFYQIALLRTISAIRHAAATGVRSGSVSMFVIVWNFILASCFTIIVLALTLQGYYQLEFLSLSSAIITVLSIVFYVLIALVLLSYRNHVEPVLKQPTPQLVMQPQYRQPMQPQYQQPVQPQYQQPVQPQYQQPVQPQYQQPVQPQYQQPVQPQYQQPVQPQYQQPVQPQYPQYDREVIDVDPSQLREDHESMQ